MVDLSRSPQKNGRIECEECGSRNTEINSSFGNKQTVTCRDCEAEFKRYIGNPCSVCNSRNTREKTVGAAPHRRKVRTCRNCDHEETLQSLDTTFTGQ